jgi:hypothetical protein
MTATATGELIGGDRRCGRGIEWDFASFSSLQTHLCCGRQKLRDADQIVCGGGEDKEPFDQVAPPVPGLRRPPVVLIQPNGLFDPLSLDHADGIARMPSGARVDRRRRRLAARADRDPQEHPEVAAARQACEHRVQRALHCGWRDRLPSGLARSVARALSRSGWDPVPLRPRGLLALAVFSNRRLDPWLVALRHSRFPLSISLWRNAFNSRAGISGPHSGGFMTKRETQIILKTERMSRFRSSRSGSPPRCT